MGNEEEEAATAGMALVFVGIKEDDEEIEVKDNQDRMSMKSPLQLLISVGGNRGGVERKTTAIGALPDRNLPSSMTPISLTDQSVCKQFSSLGS